MSSRPRAVAGVALAVVGILLGLACPGYADLPAATRARAPAPRLVVSIGSINPVLRTGKPLTVTGTLDNPSSVRWLDAQVYLQISTDPARTLRGLNEFAAVPASQGLGTTIYTYGMFDLVGDVPAGGSRDFDISVPYDALPISGKPGVYRVGLKVVAGTVAGRNPSNAFHASTLVPLLPRKPANISAVQTLTLLPITAPVKRLFTGAFADDSLASAISFGGRLYNVMAWALKAPPGTLQIAVDPALLNALDDMSHGYRVRPPPPATQTVAGKGQAAAVTWMLNFDQLRSRQYIALLPWGVPAGNSLLANNLPGPVVAAVRASADYLQANPFGTRVAGWLTDGGSAVKSISVLQHAGAGVQIVSQSSLPGLSGGHQVTRALPSLVTVRAGSRAVPVVVVATKLAGYVTGATTTGVQFRQRLIADAAVRSISGDLDQIRVTALPFRWDPGPASAEQGLDGAFALPIVVPQTLVGVAEQAGQPYLGPIRPGPASVRLAPLVVTAIRNLHLSGQPLAAILRPAHPAQVEYQQTYAMAGSYEWRAYPLVGSALIDQQSLVARNELAKVSVTGPPFVAMSSTSGRFPLTVTNGLDQDIVVRLAVQPQDPALRIGPLDVIAVPAHQRRDIQVVSTAEGSGVTSVRARLATPGAIPFGRAWKFDVRATQIGLIIWIVMGVGGVVLFGAAGYRIVNRIRGGGSSHRQVAP